MNKLNIVIIAKNITPYLSPRAHRATELAKELARQGHKVTVYAILGKYDYSSFMNETGIAVKSLAKPYPGLQDSDGNKKRTFFSKAFTVLFRWKLDFPDILLVHPTAKVIAKEKGIDLLITIGFPHSIHWGAALSIKNNKRCFKKWIADCGDPYTLNPHLKFPFYMKYIEKWWSKKVDFIAIPTSNGINGYYPEFHDKIRIIPQGFNFDEIELSEYSQNSIPHFAYSGMIYPGLRDPTLFMEYLCSLKNKEFKFIVFTNQSFFHDYKGRLGNKLEIRSYIPREELLYELSKMDFLINIRNNSDMQLPSKLIDYVQTKRPILEITSKFEEREVFDQFLSGNYEGQVMIDNINDYNIMNVAKKFSSLS